MGNLINVTELSDEYLQILINDNRKEAIEFYRNDDLDAAYMCLNIANIFCEKQGSIKPCTLEELVSDEKDAKVRLQDNSDIEDLFNEKDLSVDYLQMLVEDNRNKAIESYRNDKIDVAYTYLKISNILCNKLGYIKPCTLKELVSEL